MKKNNTLVKQTIVRITLCAGALWCGMTAFATPNTQKSDVTAIDQAKGSDHDVKTTRLIRQRVVDDGTLSIKAKNINIVTLGKTVTLKGSVDSTAELSTIKNHIRAVAVDVSIDQAHVTIAK